MNKKIKVVVKTDNLQVLFIRENDIFMCYAPALDLTAHGTDYEDAFKSFKTTLELFCEGVTKLGTWNEVLTECGWTKKGNHYSPPQIVDKRSLELSFAA